MNWWKAKQRAFAAEDGTGGGDPGTGQPPAEETTTSEPAAAPDLSFIPDDFHKDGVVDLEAFKTHLEELNAAKGRLDERLADVPEDPDGYEFAIPEIDFTEMGLPKEFALQIDPEDPVVGPLLTDLRGVLHEYGMPQAAAGKLMGVLARYEAASYKAGTDQMAADLQTLGSKHEARLATVRRGIEAKLPAELAQGLIGSVRTAAAVKALEALLGGTGGTAPTAPKTRSVQDDVDAYYTNPN